MDVLADKVRRYVFVSSVSVYADFSKSGLVESDDVLQLPAGEEDSEKVSQPHHDFIVACYRGLRASLMHLVHAFSTDPGALWSVESRLRTCCHRHIQRSRNNRAARLDCGCVLIRSYSALKQPFTLRC